MPLSHHRCVYCALLLVLTDDSGLFCCFTFYSCVIFIVFVINVMLENLVSAKLPRTGSLLLIYLFIYFFKYKSTFLAASINVASPTPSAVILLLSDHSHLLVSGPSLWWSWKGPHQTRWPLSDPNYFILGSSNQRMCCQYSHHVLWLRLFCKQWFSSWTLLLVPGNILHIVCIFCCT